MGSSRYMRLPVRAARSDGDPARHTSPAVKNDGLGWGWNVPASTRSASGVVVGVPAVIFVGDARVTGVFRVAFSLALVARDACLPCTLALANCRRHDCSVAMS